MLRGLISLIVAALAFGRALADPPPAPAADKSGYSVLNPTPKDQLRALCTDRPTKSTGPCTVDAGHWQVESDLYNITVQRGGGMTTTTELFTNPTLKLGLTNTVDLEASMTPYERVTVKDHGVTTRASGVGDLFLRLKASLIGDDGGPVAIAIEPFVKLPTANRAIGNGAVEGGLIAPIQLNLQGGWQLLFDPEVDLLENAAGGGNHANAIGLVSLGKPVSKTVTLSAELWTDSNFDPAGRTSQFSADLGAAWIPAFAPDVQFDGGVNLGLNRSTPDVQAYVGISHRF
ncbi:MAG: hypothetical protein JWO83_37 [Caulobacteraceae bacterium]|nr:hypothetical protein [Caulobacteraceae bacterium]